MQGSPQLLHNESFDCDETESSDFIMVASVGRCEEPCKQSVVLLIFPRTLAAPECSVKVALLPAQGHDHAMHRHGIPALAPPLQRLT